MQTTVKVILELECTAWVGSLGIITSTQGSAFPGRPPLGPEWAFGN